MKLRKNQTILVLISLSQILFIVSLALPALYTAPQPIHDFTPSLNKEIRPIYGWICLFFGWIGLFNDIKAIGWLANIFLIPILVTSIRKHPISMILSIIALILALSSFSFEIIKDIDGGMDETERVIGYGSGFYCWLSVFIILTISAIIQFVGILFRKKKFS